VFKRPFILLAFLLFSLPFIAQKSIVSNSVGLSYEIQKFDPFLSLRAQRGTTNPMAIYLGFSPVKASQQVFHPSLGLDYAHMWDWRKFHVGPVVQLSSNSYVFGTRFWYVHAGAGYRFLIGQKIQFMHQFCWGPSLESFTNQLGNSRQFTWNYSVKFGLQYVIR
jgi:hypothetical protein